MTEIRKSRQCFVLKGFGHWILEFRIKGMPLVLEIFIVRRVAFHCGFHGGMNNF